MSAPDLGWYLRRLRGMSPDEVRHRVLDAGRRRSWARRQVLPGGPLTLPAGLAGDRGFGPPLPPDTRDRVPAGTSAALVAAADRVLAGRWEVLGVVRGDSADPDWFADPVTGRRAPDRLLAWRVQHRDESVTGNVKQVWELSRHHHLTVLAAAWWLTGDERYAQNAADQLRSWWRANPFLSGVHWTSGIEVGVRLLSWVWVRRLLDDWPKVGDLFENDDDAIRQIGWHQEFLAAFPSRGSSANNHVLAEQAGLLAAACAFDWYPRSARWRAGAADLLERELTANTFSSGLNRELASDYHRFVLELVLIAVLEAQAAGHPMADGSWHRLVRMLDAGVAMLDVTGRPPRQGDGDEGRGLLVDDPELDPWAVALGSAAAVLGTAPWWPPAPAAPPPHDTGSVQAVLFAGLARAASGDAGLQRLDDRPQQRPRRFADAGCVILASRPQDGPQLWCRCDGGPHGFGAIAAHGHADALSVEVRHDGVELLVDPGTYCYHGEPQWRQYFRSTGAHNTLQVASLDQAESGGPFLWSTRPRTSTLSCDVGDQPVQSWQAEHDGYTRLATPVLHRRQVTLDSPEATLTVVDELVGPDGPVSRPVPVRLGWHLGPDVSVVLDGATALLRWQAGPQPRSGRLELPPELTWTAHRGETDPVAGWYSPGFGRKVAATSLHGTGAADATTRLVTTLRPAPITTG